MPLASGRLMVWLAVTPSKLRLELKPLGERTSSWSTLTAAKLGLELGAMSWGKLRVMLPVVFETLIWLAVPVRLRTPVLVRVRP